jgi:hypothetical protein
MRDSLRRLLNCAVRGEVSEFASVLLLGNTLGTGLGSTDIQSGGER